MSGTVIEVPGALAAAVSAWRADGGRSSFVTWLAAQDWAAATGPAWGFARVLADQQSPGSRALLVVGGTVDAATIAVLEALDSQLADASLSDETLVADVRRGVIDHLGPALAVGAPELPERLVADIANAHRRMLEVVQASGTEIRGDVSLLEWPSAATQAHLDDRLAGELSAAVLSAALDATRVRGVEVGWLRDVPEESAHMPAHVADTGSRDLLEEIGRRIFRRSRSARGRARA